MQREFKRWEIEAVVQQPPSPLEKPLLMAEFRGSN
jgi:hypothetical protein